MNVIEDYGAGSRAKIYGKLQAKAGALGADAVVLINKGKAHMTAFA